MLKVVATLTVLLLSLNQSLCEEEPTEAQLAQFRSMVSEWSETASRIIAQQGGLPERNIAQTAQILEETLAGVRRARRDTGEKSASDQLSEVLQGLNENIKSIVGNVTSSSLYQEAAKYGQSLGEKSKDLVSKLHEQVKNLQNQTLS